MIDIDRILRSEFGGLVGSIQRSIALAYYVPVHFSDEIRESPAEHVGTTTV